MSKWISLCLMSGLAVSGSGCGGGGGDCTPGQSAACVCTDGRGGAQVCRSDRTFDACQCTAPVGGGGGDMAGGGGGGGGDGGGGGSKRVFVTSVGYAGSAVMTVCQNAAASVNLGGTWTPWASNHYAT